MGDDITRTGTVMLGFMFVFALIFGGLSLVMYSDVNVEVIGSALHNWLPPALRAKEPWDTVTQNFGVLFRFK